ncbi:MAG: Crp/Fnr family transcriptional regulator [Verrucomicrobiota bacterium]
MAVHFSEISRMSLFRGFNEDFVRLLDVFFTEKQYPAECIIVKKGKIQKTFYMILSGEAEVFDEIENQKIIYDTLSAGQFFGEINLFDPGSAIATVISLTPLRTLEISNEKFREFISQKPGLAADFTFQLAEIVAKRFRQATDVIQKELTSPEAIRKAEQMPDKGMYT